MPDHHDRPEVLVIRGKLDRAGRFTPRRCGSTRHVREWPKAESSEYVVELLDAEGRPLHREAALIKPERGCDPGDARRWLLTAYIGFREDATALVLRRGEIVLWHYKILPAPELKVSMPRTPITRDRPLRLNLEYSEPSDGAFVQVVYRWGERRFAVVAVAQPASAIELDLSRRPGGKECLLAVEYSNGQRSAVAATRSFSLPVLGPTLTIVRPTPRTILQLGQPLCLEGQVLDPERAGGPHPNESLSWTVDGEVVGRGPIAGLDRLSAGRHVVVLRYAGIETAETSVTISVARQSEGTPVPANEWAPWDDFSHGLRP